MSACPSCGAKARPVEMVVPCDPKKPIVVKHFCPPNPKHIYGYAFEEESP